MAYNRGISVSSVVGQRFGKLVVIGPAWPGEYRTFRFRVRCDCGRELTADYLVMKRDLAIGRAPACIDCEVKPEKPTLPPNFFGDSF